MRADHSAALMLSKYQMSLSPLINHRPSVAPHSLPAFTYRYGETEWLAKAGCQRTKQKSCNLTVETGNFTEFYYANVSVVSSGVQITSKRSERFNSLQHSKGVGVPAHFRKGRGWPHIWGEGSEGRVLRPGVDGDPADLCTQGYGFQRRYFQARAHPRGLLLFSTSIQNFLGQRRPHHHSWGSEFISPLSW